MEQIPSADSSGEDFFKEGFETVHTAVFFVDMSKQRIGMLKRAAGIDFAPDLFTGVGGKVEKGEMHRAGLIREVGEETKGGMLAFGAMTEVGRLIVNGNRIVCYFTMPYSSEDLPVADPAVGTLHWVPFNEILNQELIPTARHFLEEWHKRDFAANKPFTVLVTREHASDIHSPVTSLEVRDGLVSSIEKEA